MSNRNRSSPKGVGNSLSREAIASTPSLRRTNNVISPVPLSSNRNRRTSSRRQSASSTTTPTKLPWPPGSWRRLTCFSMGLDPNNPQHKKVICDKCLKVMSRKDGVLTDAIKNTRNNDRKDFYKCEQPWDPDNANAREERRVIRYNDVCELFEDRSPPPPPPPRAAAAAAPPPPPPPPPAAKKTQPPPPPRQKPVTSPDRCRAQKMQRIHPPPPPRPPLILFDKNGNITNAAVALIEKKLKERSNANDDERKSLQPQEMKLCGMLLQMMFNDDIDKQRNNAAVSPHMKGFARSSPFQVARVPIFYMKDGEENERRRRLQTERVLNWLNLVEPNGNNSAETCVVNNAIMRANNIDRGYVLRLANKNLRFDVESTLAIIKLAGINPRQMEKLMQGMDVESRGLKDDRGLRLFPPVKKLYEEKKRHVVTEYPTLKATTVRMLEKVGNKKDAKGATIREEDVTCLSLSLDELVYSQLTALIQSENLLPAEKRYQEPFPLPDDCESVLYKLAMDKGGNTVKGTGNMCNVKNPQGQEHVRPFLIFDAKDSYENLARVFEAHPSLKNEMEDILNRKLMLLAVSIGDSKGFCMVKNTDKAHDYKKPSSLPGISPEFVPSTSPQPSPASQTVDKYTIAIDFSAVKKTKLIYNEATKSFEGLSFEDELGNRIGDVLFKTAIPCENKLSVPISMRKIMVLGILSSDLDLLYTLFGHQGCSALWHCLFCYINKRDTTKIFDNPAFRLQVDERTIEKIKRDAQIYANEYEDKLNLSQQSKRGVKPNITQTMSNSITRKPLLDVPLECITRASMHIILGFTKWLVDVTMSGYECILEMEVSKVGGGTTPAHFSKRISDALSKLTRYREFLTDETNTLSSTLVEQDSSYSEIISEIEEIEDIIENDFGLTPEKEAELVQKLDALNKRKELVDASTRKVVGDGKYSMLLLEQMTILKQTQDELATVQHHHEGHVTRVVKTVLKKNGVDMEAYFNGAIVGNHCRNYAERGESIYSGCFEVLESDVKDPQHRIYLETFTEKMKEIAALWFKILRVMKSVDKQSEHSIMQFEANVDKLRELIHDLIKGETPVIPGWKQKLPSSLKSHLLFFGHLVAQLKLWRTLGCFDEQNIESAHAIWNALLRQFGATRGRRLKQVVLNAFLFNSSSVINDKVAHIKSKLKRKTPHAPPRRRDATDVDSVDDCVVEQVVESGKLDDIHVQINEEVAFHPQLPARDDDEGIKSPAVETKDTEVVVCPHCSKIMLQMALQIHCNESHGKNEFSSR